MKVHSTALCFAAAMLSAVGVSQAVLVSNYSFEDGPTGDAVTPDGWDEIVVGNGGVYVGTGTDGLNLATLAYGRSLGQTLGEVIALGTEYQATADARASWWGVLQITLYSDDGLGGLVDLATTTIDPGSATSAYAPISVSYTTGAADVGKNLGVRITEASGGTNNWSEWDNVAVEVIPEPATLGLVGLTAVGTLFIRRRLMM